MATSKIQGIAFHKIRGLVSLFIVKRRRIPVLGILFLLIIIMEGSHVNYYYQNSLN